MKLRALVGLGGRPKEEGGHKDWHLSFNKITTEALNKIKKGGGSASEALEKAFKPMAEKYDPGELSKHVWRYEIYLSQQIAKALEEGKPENVQGLASLLTALKDYRSLSGIPPLNLKLLSTETTPLWKKRAIEDFTKIRNAWVDQDPDELVLLPEATLACIDTYPKLVEELMPERKELVKQINWAYKPSHFDWYLREVETRTKLKQVARTTVPKILRKAFKLIYENGKEEF